MLLAILGELNSRVNKLARNLADVLEDCRRNLQIFKGCLGCVMMDGHKVEPGTPAENLNAMAEAAARFRSF